MERGVGMLVLKLGKGDILQVGEDVRIYVRRLSAGGVRVCVEAPRDVAVSRLPALQDSEGPDAVSAPDDESPDNVTVLRIEGRGPRGR
ncbi:MAG: Global regulator protein family [Pseudomonadota bacterium]